MSLELAITGQRTTKGGFSEVTVSYKGSNLTFATPGYESAKACDSDRMFSELNAFIRSRLNAVEQDYIFQLYQYCHQVHQTRSDTNTVGAAFTGAIKNLYQVATYEKINDFTRAGNVTLPTDLKTSYQEGHPAEKTYLRDDYIDILNLAIGLKFLIPLWGDYMTLVAVESSQTHLKEFKCFNLVNGSLLPNWPPMKRLEVYCESILGSCESTVSTLSKNMPTIMIPVYLRCKVSVRKIAVSALSARTNDENLIRVIYNYIDGGAARIESAFGGHTSDKPAPIATDDGDNQSVLDGYRQSEIVSVGIKAMLDDYGGDVNAISSKMEGVSIDLINDCIRGIREDSYWERAVPESHVYRFVENVMKVQISPVAIRSAMGFNSLVVLMGCSQAWMIHKGHYELAALLTAERIITTDKSLSLPFEQLSKVAIEELAAIYPYIIPKSGSSGKINPRNSFGALGVESIFVGIANAEWKLRGSPNAMSLCLKEKQNVRVYKLPLNLRELIAQFIIDTEANDYVV